MGVRGQALIEFALIIPFLFFLALGLLDIGRGYFVNHSILNAAREGARTAILPIGSEADARVTAVAVLTNAGLCAASCPGGMTISITNAGSAAPPGSTTVVSINFPFQTVTGDFIPSWTGVIPMNQTIRMRHE